MKPKKNYRPCLWRKYGLSLAPFADGTEFRNACIAHNLVYDYLEAHSEVRLKYNNDQSGKLKYFDILSLAEKELKRERKNFKEDQENVSADNGNQSQEKQRASILDKMQVGSSDTAKQTVKQEHGHAQTEIKNR